MRYGMLSTLFAIMGTLTAVAWTYPGSPADAPSRASRTVSDQAPERQVFAQGIVEGSCREIGLRFELTGRLLSIGVREGDRVRAGDVIAQLDATTLQCNLLKAEAGLQLAEAEKTRLLNGQSQESAEVFDAEVRVAEVRLEQARKNFERVSRLVNSRAVSLQERDDRQAELNHAEAHLRLAQSRAREASARAREDDIAIADARIALEKARVADARDMLAKAVLRSPIDGVVAQVRGEMGELVVPDAAESLVTLLDVRELRVRAYVEELDAVRMQAGMVARVSADGLPGQFFTGQVTSCSPFMIPKRQLSNRPGERVDVKVREVLLLLEQQLDLECLVVGLPVDVYFSVPTDSVLPSTSSPVALTMPVNAAG